MSFKNFKKVEATNFQSGRVLVTGMYDSNYPVNYAVKADGSKRRMYEGDALEVDERLESVPAKVVSFKPIVVVDGIETFEETVQATIEVSPRTFVNMVETPEAEEYKGQMGAVAAATYVDCVAEHASGNLQVGDTYSKLTKLAFTLDNKSVRLALGAKAGMVMQF